MAELAYKFKGSGHDVPEEKRKYEEPDSRLAKIFETVLDEGFEEKFASLMSKTHGGEYFNRHELELLGKFICESVGREKFSADEAKALLLLYQDHENIEKAGEFITALYNNAKEKVIIHDVDIGKPIKRIGKGLAENKVLVNKAPIGNHFGSDAHGIIINYADEYKFAHPSSYGLEPGGIFLNYGKIMNNAGEHSDGLWINAGIAGALGEKSEGLVLNFGKTNEFGEEAKSTAILVNAGEADKFGNDISGVIIALKAPKQDAKTQDSTYIGPEQCSQIPKLQAYFDKIRQKVEAGRHDYNLAIKLAVSLDAEKMRQRLAEILKDNLEGLL